MPPVSQSYKSVIYLDPNEGILKYKRLSDGASFPLPFVQNNTFKLREKDIFPVANSTEYEILPIQTNDGIPTYSIREKKSAPQFVGGGKNTPSGIIVQDEDVSLFGRIQTLNFEGAGVIVTADGNGKATVTIGGGGMVFGTGTPNRLAMFTAPNTIGDSPFLRSGSDVTADGFMYFLTGNGIDVVASGGADILNIGASNADVINYGYSGTTHNFSGAVFNAFTTNLNVEDKLITLNSGGAGGSGGNAGFEIEEGGIATGYFIQNTTRDGFDFQASGVTGVATFDLSGLTGNQTATLQDASGTIAYLSDIPAPVDAFVQNGNSFGANAVLGTNDVFALSFETSGVTRSTISSGGLWGINASPVAGTLWYQQGNGTTSATYTAQYFNATPTVILSVRDDQRVGIRTSSPDSPLHILNSGNDSISMGIDGSGTTNRARIFLGQGSGGFNAEELYFVMTNSAMFFQVHTSGSSTLLALTGGATQNSRGISMIDTGTDSPNFDTFHLVTETSNTNGGDRAIYAINLSATVGGGAGANYGVYGEASGVHTTQGNIGGFFTAVNGAYNFAISTDAGNIGIGISSTIGVGDRVMAIINGTEPTALVVDGIKIFSVDSDDATATLGLYLEQAVEAIGTFTESHKIKVKINGDLYWISLDAVTP